MAIMMSYLLYSNQTTSLLAMRWFWWPMTNDERSKQRKEEVANAHRSANTDSVWWSNGLGAAVAMGPLCCCFSSEQHFVYTRENLAWVLQDITHATEHLDHSDTYKLDTDSLHMLRRKIGMLHPRSIPNCLPQQEMKWGDETRLS